MFYWFAAPTSSNYMISDPWSSFLTYWFLEILGLSYIFPEKCLLLLLQLPSLGHALLSDAQLGKMFCCWCPIQRWDKRPSYRFSKKDHRNWLQFPYSTWMKESGLGERICGISLGRAFAVSLISFSRVMADCQWDQWIFPEVNGGHSGLGV